MITLYFLRHASAGERLADPEKDQKRPLDKEGIEQCRYVGHLLAQMDVQIDALVSSPLKRATQTAALIGNELGFEGRIILDAALAPGADFAAFRDLLRRASKLDSLMVVGHNPNLSEFLSLLISDRQSEISAELKKGACARVSLRGKGDATLDWLITPKIVRTAYSVSASRSRRKTSRK